MACLERERERWALCCSCFCGYPISWPRLAVERLNDRDDLFGKHQSDHLIYACFCFLSWLCELCCFSAVTWLTKPEEGDSESCWLVAFLDQGFTTVTPWASHWLKGGETIYIFKISPPPQSHSFPILNEIESSTAHFPGAVKWAVSHVSEQSDAHLL